MGWVACRVQTGKEYLLRAQINRIDPVAEIYIPRKNYKETKDGVVKTKSERILPGYLLFKTDKPLDAFRFDNLIKIIGPVEDPEIVSLKAQEGLKEANLGVGLKVLVIDGPLQGCKGAIKSSNEDGTYNCRLTFQGMEINARMKQELVTPIN